MRSTAIRSTSFIALTLLLLTAARAQEQVTVTTPFQSLNDSYSESMGINFGLSGPGFFFNNGLAGPSAPFGPVTGGARFGGSGRVGGVGFRWNAFAEQGSSRSMVMAAPSLTTMNGAGGFFASGSVRPFVTGIVPFVADRVVSPVDLSLEQLEASGGLERTLVKRRAERKRAEQAEDEAAQRQALPPLPRQDDPPLILNGANSKQN